jgi:hypothetical protein
MVLHQRVAASHSFLACHLLSLTVAASHSFSACCLLSLIVAHLQKQQQSTKASLSIGRVGGSNHCRALEMSQDGLHCSFSSIFSHFCFHFVCSSQQDTQTRWVEVCILTLTTVEQHVSLLGLVFPATGESVVCALITLKYLHQVMLKIINMFMSEHKRNIKKVKRCEVPFKLVDASHFGLS